MLDSAFPNEAEINIMQSMHHLRVGRAEVLAQDKSYLQKFLEILKQTSNLKILNFPDSTSEVISILMCERTFLLQFVKALIERVITDPERKNEVNTIKQAYSDPFLEQEIKKMNGNKRVASYMQYEQLMTTSPVQTEEILHHQMLQFGPLMSNIDIKKSNAPSTLLDKVVYGTSRLINHKTPVLNKKEVKKYRGVQNFDPKRTLYLRIPPPSERSIIGLSPYLTEQKTKEKINLIERSNFQLDAHSDSSDEIADIDDDSSGNERQSRHAISMTPHKNQPHQQRVALNMQLKMLKLGAINTPIKQEFPVKSTLTPIRQNKNQSNEFFSQKQQAVSNLLQESTHDNTKQNTSHLFQMPEQEYSGKMRYDIIKPDRESSQKGIPIDAFLMNLNQDDNLVGFSRSSNNTFREPTFPPERMAFLRQTEESKHHTQFNYLVKQSNNQNDRFSRLHRDFNLDESKQSYQSSLGTGQKVNNFRNSNAPSVMSDYNTQKSPILLKEDSDQFTPYERQKRDSSGVILMLSREQSFPQQIEQHNSDLKMDASQGEDTPGSKLMNPVLYNNAFNPSQYWNPPSQKGASSQKHEPSFTEEKLSQHQFKLSGNSDKTGSSHANLNTQPSYYQAPHALPKTQYSTLHQEIYNQQVYKPDLEEQQLEYCSQEQNSEEQYEEQVREQEFQASNFDEEDQETPVYEGEENDKQRESIDNNQFVIYGGDAIEKTGQNPAEELNFKLGQENEDEMFEQLSRRKKGL
ncbi:hypothetical protein FGO68_gene3935 [Halteria grandinella]|uniref:Uncharacterized protein n=1 Tax=Halteria grandinella TaxID=5974 RepID=A0A8J8P3R2_HALGN|nr:hypothetical protein FGO68_gene3935 [Halteria grandinella]